MPTDADAPAYTIAELARLAAVTPRTIRYYVAQGLLPSPGTLGPSSRYGDGHLARLRLIRRLQRRHLPLAEIRRQVVDLSDTEVDSALSKPEQTPPAGSSAPTALAYIRSVLGEAPKPDRDPSRFRLQEVQALHASPMRLAAVPARPAPDPRSLRAADQLATPDRSQWERISLVPDVELHVRRPSSRLLNKRVDRLVAIARELLEEDRP